MRLAILDDDPHLLESVTATLTQAGHSCHAYVRSRDLMFDLKRESFDLLLIDWVIPEISGMDVLRLVRDMPASPPVVMMTSRDAEADVVEALEAGADDYLVKPLRAGELVARLAATLRRSQPQADLERQLTIGPFRFDLNATLAWRDGTAVDMTHKEFSLAVLMLRNLGKPLSRGHLREAVWGGLADVPTRTLDTHISRVRIKLDLRPERGYMLAPIYSFGYRLELLEDAAPLETHDLDRGHDRGQARGLDDAPRRPDGLGRPEA